MRLALSCFVLFLLVDTPAEPSLPYFASVREIRISRPDLQNFFVVDAELWAHSRPDLGDLRLYDGQSSVQYELSEQRAGTAWEEVDAKILNLGTVSGRTEFDLDTQGLAEYDRIRLRLDAHDFVATASVSGGSASGKAAGVELPPTTLFDFTKEQLGSNSVLKMPRSSFRYLHVRLSGGILPQQVKGAGIANLREQQASWTNAGSCAAPRAKQRTTEIACEILPKVPLNRILFRVEPAQVNFRRTVSVEDASGIQISSGEITRVRVNRAGTLVTYEELAVKLNPFNAVDLNNGGRGHLILAVDNGDNPPLTILAAEPLSLERLVYFDPQGKSALSLYYGDEQLPAPAYDYAHFFHLDPSPAEAQLGPGGHNPQYTGRPDKRPWSERHTSILWGAMIMAVLALSALALRGLRTEQPR
jgi:hypothetical protein